MAEQQSNDDLIRQGLSLFSTKRYAEAASIFQQVLALEPRHIGAAYMLSVAYYFSGSFREAEHLFRQLTAPESPLEPAKIAGLLELSNYARYELLRLNYWLGLAGIGAGDIHKELKIRNLQASSIEAFHMHLANGSAAQWLEIHSEFLSCPTVRVTTRANEILILKNCRDVDDGISAFVEAIRSMTYSLLPMQNFRIIEVGPLKRWMMAQAEYANGRRETLTLPLTYRNSMTQAAHGVREGVETIRQPREGCADFQQAFGQKQLSHDMGKIAWSRILRIEVEPAKK